MTRIAEFLVQQVDTEYIAIVNRETCESVTIRIGRAKDVAAAIARIANRMESGQTK